MPFSGMLRSTPPGSEALIKAPRLAAPLAAELAALLMVEELRVRNQKIAARTTTRPMMGQSQLRAVVVACDAAADAREVRPERPGIERPAGRKLRKLGNSDSSMLTRP